MLGYDISSKKVPKFMLKFDYKFSSLSFSQVMAVDDLYLYKNFDFRFLFKCTSLSHKAN